jgi:hypothetical protein
MHSGSAARERQRGAAALARRGNGNVYIAGTTDGANQGDFDAWVAKYSAAGALRWKRQLGTTDTDAAFGAATDRDGNIYIAGYTWGSLGGPNQGTGDAWAAKYSAAGTLRWKRQLGTPNFETAEGVATDGDGHVYIAGRTDGSLGGPNQGDDDAWVAQYSTGP